MAGSPDWKVYDPSGAYVAACKQLEDAAALAAAHGYNATIRYRHSRIVWREGLEDQPAAESYDYVAQLATKRTWAGR